MVGHRTLCDNLKAMTGVSQEAFTQVLWVVVILGLIAAIAAIATTGEALKQIGKGGLFNEDELLRPAPSPASVALRNDEIRQMLEARNFHRVRRGQQPLDIEQELATLTRPGVDQALVDEITELIEARNRRRIRQGREPLDVHAEITRHLQVLDSGA
jgi:hypothetical protein